MFWSINKFTGGAFSKVRITSGCIALLGITAGAGITNVVSRNNNLSSTLATFSNLFKGSEKVSELPPSPLDPFGTISSVASWTWHEIFSKVLGFLGQSYEWVRNTENHSTIISLLGHFWNFAILKQILFNFPWTVLAWIKIFMEKKMVYKFPLSFKRATTFSVMLIATKNDNQELLKMVNWIFLRLLIHPRKTLNILSRPLSGKTLICNGEKAKGPKGGATRWLGTCFFEGNGEKPPKPKSLKLKEDIKHFLETGENLRDKSRKGEKKTNILKTNKFWSKHDIV